MLKIGIIMGSDSDFPVLKNTVKTLKEFGVDYEISVISAHRSPQKAEGYSKSALSRGIGVLICAAGKAAHLAGVMAANTPLPVIGLPIKSSTMDGLDSLLSTVQMPKGIPVATVAIDGADNAALLAIQMLALSEPTLMQKMIDYKKAMAEAIEAKDAAIKEAAKEL